MGLSSGCKISNSIAYLFDKFIPLIANDANGAPFDRRLYVDIERCFLFAELNDGEKGN